ncbi:hypothetical protein KAS50_08860, partial [bacterium]|nr:hypothetical protein [bacterium]
MKRIIYFFIIFLFLSQGLSAQIYDFFGRNKVQYKDFDWNIMDTEHFKIFFYPEMKELAEIGAHYAEEAYERLENKFNYTIDKKIPLIFYSSHPHFQQTNVIPSFLPEGVGGFFEFLKGRVVTPHQGSLSDFKKVINHELVHVFMYAKFNGIYRAHKKYTFSGPPLWFTEGLAEAWSGEWDMRAEMVIRDAVLSGYLVPITNMYSIMGSFLMYKEGESFIRYLSERYGDEKILLIMENFWKAKNIHVVMRMTYGGKSLKELNKEWVYYLKKKYYPVIKDEDMPSMGAEEVTSKGFNSKPVYYKSNGEEYVIFVSNRTGYTNIYMKRLKNKEEIIQKKENDDAE